VRGAVNAPSIIVERRPIHGDDYIYDYLYHRHVVNIAFIKSYFDIKV